MSEIKKNNRSFYDANDRESKEREIMLNCTGECALSRSFSTLLTDGRGDFYLMYMLSGEMSLTVKGESFSFGSGDAIIIPPHTAYMYTNGESGTPIHYLWMHFTGSKCNELITSCGITPSTVLKIGLTNQIIDKFDELFFEFINRTDRFNVSTATLVQYIIMTIGGLLVNSAKNEPKRLYKSVEYIHAHLKEPLFIEDLAKMEFLSPSRYRQLFYIRMGRSPVEYITLQRIYRACELLSQGDIPLSRVAEMCGYTDRLYFQRVFKKVIGVPPGEYKKRFHS